MTRSRLVTCGYPVDSPVDNSRSVRISALRDVDIRWITKKLEINNQRLLRDGRAGSRNTFTVWKRVPSGGRPRNVRGTGKPEPHAGAWHRRAARRTGMVG